MCVFVHIDSDSTEPSVLTLHIIMGPSASRKAKSSHVSSTSASGAFELCIHDNWQATSLTSVYNCRFSSDISSWYTADGKLWGFVTTRLLWWNFHISHMHVHLQSVYAMTRNFPAGVAFPSSWCILCLWLFLQWLKLKISNVTDLITRRKQQNRTANITAEHVDIVSMCCTTEFTVLICLLFSMCD